MSEMNANWDDLRLFLAVARGGGLSAAIAETGKSAPTLGRRMLALESKLAFELFHREAKGYRLTADGEKFFEQVCAMEARIESIFPQAKGGTGLVKVSAGSWVTHALCENLSRIVTSADPVTLRFISTEETLDITHREAVIGIRNQRPQQEGLVCRKLGRVQFAVYAANKSVTTWAKVVGTTPSSQWLDKQLSGKRNKELSIEVTSPRNALDLTLHGSTRMILPTFIGDHQKRLKRLSNRISELSHDQWLVTHPEERFRKEVRLVIDRTVAVLLDLQ